MLNQPQRGDHPGSGRDSGGGIATAGRLLVRKLETYGTLPGDDRAALTSIGAESRVVETGHDIALEEAQPQGFYVVVEGFACRYKLAQSGQRNIIAYLLPGDFCDLDLLPRMDHSIGALSKCTVARLLPSTVQDLRQRPTVARALRLATLAEVANTREWLVNVGGRRAIVRVAHLLCELFARLHAVGLTEKGSFGLPLTQSDLADTLGISTVHMNRSLQGLRDAKLLSMRHGRVTIDDLPRLEEFAQFKPHYLYLDAKSAA